MKRQRGTLAVLCAAAIAALLLTYLQPFNNADLYLADKLYQRGGVSSGKIVIVELDEKSMEAFGRNPLDWDRTVYARVLDNLNAADDCHPAVIGLDILFAHEGDRAGDEALAEAASYGNVVTAGMYYYGSRLETAADGSYTWEQNTVIESALPYSALAAVTETGVANVTLDQDSIVRHAVLLFPGDAPAPSFAAKVVQQYAAATGSPFTLPECTSSYIDYTYPSGGYREAISFADVYNNVYPASYFNGKIVLIGACASSMQDEYLTPISRRSAMYGVEIHANVIEMLLRAGTASGSEAGDASGLKSEASGGLQRLVLAAALGAMVLICMKSGKVRRMFASLLLCSFGWVLICSFAYSRGFVLHPLWLPAGAAVIFVTGVAVRYAAEAASRRQLRRQFERYVDPAVLKQVLDQGAEGLSLEGKERNIAVLFVDICGFTSLSERLAPAEVVAVLNRYLEMVTDCIMRNGGTLDKFIGDCAMAFWNAPFEEAAPVSRTLRAGLDMIAGAKALNERLGFDLGFAIGIHYGRAVVGNIGSGKRLDFTAIGDTVNTASRLESLKIAGTPREGRVYFSQEVLDALRSESAGAGSAVMDVLPEIQDLGMHFLKGKEQPVRVYSVAGAGAAGVK